MVSMKMSKWLRRMIICVLAILLLLIISLFYISPGKTSSIVDVEGNKLPNSIAVIEKPNIGGVSQGLIIRGNNIENPVLLYLHGGPGMPSFSWIKEDFKKIETLFTICYWEQRGAGMSYSKSIPRETMNLPQLADDAAAITHYLMKKFNKKKIYLMGHSWGTFLGSFIIHKYPDLYFAYLGVGQTADVYQSEKESYQFVTAEAGFRNDRDAQKKLKNLQVPPMSATAKEWWEYLKIQREYVFKFGGAIYGHSISLNTRRKAVLFCREYTLNDKINFSKGLEFSVSCLENTLMTSDLNVALPEQQIPVYIFQGLHDYQTTYTAAKKYFDSLRAPVKKFYTFLHSAHSPHIEEYDAFERIVKNDILSTDSSGIQ
jgi:pimeloyl-ACP methyl ester carboxylesterase